MAGVASLGLAAPALAEGESNANAIDTTLATTALSDMSTAVQGYFTAAVPYLVSILGVALVVTLIWVAFKLIKRGTNKA